MPDRVATADLYDEYEESLGCCSTQFHQYGARTRFQGVAVTLKGHEDNALLKRVVNEPGHGKVIVIDGDGSLHCAMLGDKNAQLAADNGWEGFVVNGAVRDAGASRRSISASRRSARVRARAIRTVGGTSTYPSPSAASSLRRASISSLTRTEWSSFPLTVPTMGLADGPRD